MITYMKILFVKIGFIIMLICMAACILWIMLSESFCDLFSNLKLKMRKLIKNKTFIKRTLECIFHPPAMRWVEFNLIKNILEAEKPKRCLEWGSGFSTKHYSKLVAKWGGTWTAIEHDERWYKKFPKAEVFCVKPNNPLWVGDGTYEDFKDYVNFPHGQYDFILIDGRARKACIERRLSKFMIIHDAERYNLEDWTIIGRIGIYKK